MAVMCQQRDDGMNRGSVQGNGPEYAIQLLPGETDTQALERKRVSHVANGWSVQSQQGGRRLIFTKTYPSTERNKDHQTYLTKQRTLRIV